MPRGTRKSNDEPTRGKKRPSASHTEDYLSDDGFVADGSHDGGPKKKAKTATNKPRPLAKGKAGEEESWELTDKRRVQISEFKGMQMVGIREFYEKDGEMLPAKKGISLTVPQYNALVALLPQIETSLAAKGESVVRPDYDGTTAPAAPKNKEAEIAEEETDGEGGGDEEKTGAKKNFEATSEEEEEG